MKKRISLVLIIFVMLFSIIGCKKNNGNNNNNNNNNNNKTQEELDLEKLEKVANAFVLPTETAERLTLPTEIEGVSVRWDSGNTSVLSNQGVVRRSNLDVDVRLKGFFTYNNQEVLKIYDIKVLRYSDVELLKMVFDSLEELPSSTDEDLYLETLFDYGVEGVWTSSNEKIISTTGVFRAGAEDEVVTLKIKLTLGEESMEKEYKVSTEGIGAVEEVKYNHLVLQYANEFNSDNYENVTLDNNLLVLTENQISGTYESDVIPTLKWNELVGSWAAVSSKEATVEFFVKARVNGVWSNYITYGKWGLGLENASNDQNNGVIKLSTDEVMVLNSKTADAVQYKLVLRRNNANVESPKVSLVALALNISGYSYPVDITDVEKNVKHNVPKLYQGEVPTIGNSICSATSTCMLLKYKGEDFSGLDQYEHRYMAYLVRDYGNNIFGNWVYNTVTMGGFGYNAYVKRMYSLDELIRHLNDVGPVSLSMKGQMTSDKKNYYTNGHLIVITGYYYDNNGNLFFYSNDPNVPEVDCVYTESVIRNTWRMIAYIIE